MNSKWLEQAWRYLRFMLSTLAGTAVDTFVLWLFAHKVFKGWYVGETIVSPTISFECAVIVNFIFFCLFVWRDRTDFSNRRRLAQQFVKYNVSCVAGFLLKMVLLVGVQWLSGWDVVICNLIALCFSGIFNFVINDLWVYSKKYMRAK